MREWLVCNIAVVACFLSGCILRICRRHWSDRNLKRAWHGYTVRAALRRTCRVAPSMESKQAAREAGRLEGQGSLGNKQIGRSEQPETLL
ncbi:hypothetical protein F4860DRAFT_466639 [Xylaria cubensis]|nr:hypothetical protein F4860DRAFT_466639 [Xylaria cubensis]